MGVPPRVHPSHLARMQDHPRHKPDLQNDSRNSSIALVNGGCVCNSEDKSKNLRLHITLELQSHHAVLRAI